MEHMALSAISMLSLTATRIPGDIARRLNVRLRRKDVALRGLLCDYLYGIIPGGKGSSLKGASDDELHKIRQQLIRELVGAIRDVADVTESRWRRGLHRLAEEIDDYADEPRAHASGADVIKEWLTISRISGANEMEFLQIC